jgi:hypothetical protein
MRFPIKLNRSFWPESLSQKIPSAVDPRVLCSGGVDEIAFTSAISSFKFGATYKSTQKARFPLTILEIVSLPYQNPPVVLDVGASDGSTSLDIMRMVAFEKYFVTDLHIEVSYQVSGGITWFYDEKGNCVLMVTNKWVNYPDTKDAVFPFNKIAKSLFSHAPQYSETAPHINLFNPLLKSQKNGNVFIEKYNILEPWPHEKADLILAANILNPGYFTVTEMELALRNLVAALNQTGRIVIIDNRPSEKSTIYQFTEDNVKIEKKVNGGTDVEGLALEIFSNVILSTR